jgi:mitochondrial-processing peptidase subunit alpha
VTTLPNGVRVASENTVGATANIGIYVDAGSIYEGPGSHGVSHLMQHLGFKVNILLVFSGFLWYKKGDLVP